jgi:predicted Ser/Thr protein kinase
VTGTSERRTVPRLGAVVPLQPGDPRAAGRYLLTGRLGAGGMGTVYLGHAAAGGPAVAVKVVHPELAADPSFRGRFAGEVAAARRVAPFCTARVLDADPAADPPYLVTEFVDGVPLGKAVLDGGPLDESTLHGVALGVAAALAAVHAAGVVHRDLKPANVLLSLSGPRVIDFGIARALDGPRPHTQAGTVIGTPGWMAPEQFRSSLGPIGPASDVFSWGSLVAYAATGRNPWEARGHSGQGLAPPPAALAERIVHGRPDLDGLSGPLRRLVEAALAKDPARRPTSRALVDELLGVERRAGAGPVPVPGGDPTVAATRFVERTWAGPPTIGRGQGPGPAGRGRGLAGPGRPGSPRPLPPAAYPPTVAAGPPPTVAFPTRRRDADGGRRGWFRARTTRVPPAPPPVAPPAGPPPAAPRKRRRWWRRKRVLIPLGLLLLVALLPREDQPGPPPGSGGTDSPRTDLGRPVRDGQLEFVVGRWRCGVERLGSGPLAREPEGTFCLADVRVRNIGDSARTLLEPFQKVRDSADRTHGADFAARFYFPGQTLWSEVRPGESAAGTMVFDLPDGADAVRLELHDGIASGGADVRL